MAERRVLQFDHCDDQTRFEIEIVQEKNAKLLVRQLQNQNKANKRTPNRNALVFISKLKICPPSVKEAALSKLKGRLLFLEKIRKNLNEGI